MDGSAIRAGICGGQCTRIAFSLQSLKLVPGGCAESVRCQFWYTSTDHHMTVHVTKLSI